MKRKSLIRELVIKDLKIRYSRPFLGFFWAFLSPLLNVAIFYLIFSLLLKVKTREGPFVLYLMSAIFPWRFFQDSLICSASSLIDNKHLIRESYFPHYLLPVSIVLANFINFIPSLLLLVFTSLILLKGLPYFFFFLPLILCLHIIIAIGLSIIFSILYVRWRDIKYILEAVLQILFYLTPVFYSIYLVKETFPLFLFSLYLSNPFVAMLNLYRLALLKGFYPLIKADVSLLSLIVISTSFTVILMFTGLYFYKKNKNSINDYLSY